MSARQVILIEGLLVAFEVEEDLPLFRASFFCSLYSTVIEIERERKEESYTANPLHFIFISICRTVLRRLRTLTFI